MMKDVVQRGTAAGAVGSRLPRPGRRQDGHDERRRRRLVHRLHGRPRRRRLDGLRQAAEDQGERAGRRARRAGVDVVHDARCIAASRRRPTGRGPRASSSGRSITPPGSSGRRAAARRSPTTSSPAPSRSPPASRPRRSYPTTPGTPGEPTTSPVDTSFGFPAPTTPAPRPDTRPCRASARRAAPSSHRAPRRSRARRARVPRATPPALRSARPAAPAALPPAPADDSARHEQPVHASPDAAQMTWQPVDCHAHSTHSDGALSVADVVEQGARAAACGRASPTTSRATRRRRVDSPRAVGALSRRPRGATTCCASGEFCWHDALWRELPPRDRAPLHAPRRLAALHSPRRRRLLPRLPSRLPSGLTPRPTSRRTSPSLEALAGEMPVDVFAHPTLISPSLRASRSARVVERGARGAPRARAARGGHRVRDLATATARTSASSAAPPTRGVRLSLGSDGHSREQVADVAHPLALARAVGVRDEELYDPTRHGSRTGAFDA